jgi:ribosomal protein S21
MLIVKVENKNLDKALKILKGKVIKSKQVEELKEKLEYKSKSQKKRALKTKAQFKERFNSKNYR